MRLEDKVLGCFRAGILAIDLQGTVVFVNDLATKILDGFAVDKGDSLRPLAGENAFFRMLTEALDLRYLPARVEVSLPGRSGATRSFGFTLSELKEEDRRIGICAFFKDLTHVEMAEENRDLNERLRLLGQMAAGLAHEIRNPIASIGVHCGLLRSRFGNDPKILASVGLMEREIAKVEYIIRECLNFVRPAEFETRPVPVVPFLQRVAVQSAKLFDGVRFEFLPDVGESVTVEMDEGLMEQALNNIVANAAQACDGSGTVSISARVTRGYWDFEADSREPFLSGETGEKEDFLTVSVRDTGPGIAEDIRDKIFVPFFTTKKGGTGIGLPLAQKIVYAHKGMLDILSEPGKGTEFIVKIPARAARV